VPTPTARPSVKRSLQLYLQGHHAGARAAVASVRSQASAERGSDLGELLAHLADEIEEDRRTLLAVMARLGLRPSALRDLGARIGGFAARWTVRLHFPGRPQARLIGIESLSLGIEGKLRLWCALRALLPDDPRLGPDPRLGAIDFDALIERAERQRVSLEPHRVEAARQADANIDRAFEPEATAELPPVEAAGAVDAVGVSDDEPAVAPATDEQPAPEPKPSAEDPRSSAEDPEPAPEPEPDEVDAPDTADDPAPAHR
jgi:hypothetical protein